MLDYIISCLDGYFETLIVFLQFNHPLIDYHYPTFIKWKNDGFVFDDSDYSFILEMYEDIHYVYRCALEI